MSNVRGATAGAIRKSRFKSGTAKVLRSLRLPCMPVPREVLRESETETTPDPPPRVFSTHTSVPRRPRTGGESPISVHEVFFPSENADATPRFAAARTLTVSNPDLHGAVLSGGSFGENDESTPEESGETRTPEQSSWFHDNDETEEALAQLSLPIQAPPQQGVSIPAKQLTRPPPKSLSWSTSKQRANSLAHIVGSLHPSEHPPLPAPTYPADPHLSAFPLLTDFDLNPSLQGPYSRFPPFLASTAALAAPQTQPENPKPQIQAQLPQIQIQNPTSPTSAPNRPTPNNDPTAKRISLLHWRPKAATLVSDAPARTTTRTDFQGDVVLHRHHDALVVPMAPEEGVPFCPPSFRGEESEVKGRAEQGEVETRKWRGSELFLPKQVVGEVGEMVEEKLIPRNPARLSSPFDAMLQVPLQSTLEATKAVKRKAPLEDDLPLEAASRATRPKHRHPIALRAARGLGVRGEHPAVRGMQGQEAVELPGNRDSRAERQRGMQAWRTWRMSLGAPFGWSFRRGLMEREGV